MKRMMDEERRALERSFGRGHLMVDELDAVREELDRARTRESRLEGLIVEALRQLPSGAAEHARKLLTSALVDE